jgi:Mg2+-importing ATPase
MATLIVVIVTTILPFTPLGEVFGFSRLPISFLVLIAIIIMGYIVTAEMAKMIFYKKVKL